MDALTVLEQSPVVDSDGNTQLHRAVMGGDTVGTRLFLSWPERKIMTIIPPLCLQLHSNTKKLFASSETTRPEKETIMDTRRFIRAAFMDERRWLCCC